MPASRHIQKTNAARLLEAAGIPFELIPYPVDENNLAADHIAEELGVQSMQRVAMSASIEDEYDVMIPVAKFGQFETIGALVDFVMEEA